MLIKFKKHKTGKLQKKLERFKHCDHILSANACNLDKIWGKCAEKQKKGELFIMKNESFRVSKVRECKNEAVKNLKKF